MVCTSLAVGQTRSTDTLWIDSIVTHSGQKAIIDIEFSNAAILNAIDVPIRYEYPEIIIDSVSFAGSRVEDRFLTLATIDTALAQCHIGAFYFDTTQQELGPGMGLLARLHVTIPDEFPTRLIEVDTTRIVTSLTFVDENDQSFVPIFEKGYIDNTYTPTLADSVWIDNIDVTMGQHFSLPVHAFTENPVASVRIPIEFQADNIDFDSMSVDGTRSLNAVLSDVMFDNDDKHLYIMLSFAEQQLLPAGGGPIAILYFTSLTGGSTASVDLDTTDQGFGDYFFQLGMIYSNVKTFPRYIAGTINVDLATDVDDDNTLMAPRTYSLDQNHPNPFNPTTSISFGLPAKSQVRLDVYNVLGQKVRSLVDGDMPAGYHSVTFDGTDSSGRPVASGIYFYRLTTDTFTQSRKMILMK
jgi:hypothetical protein